VCGLGLSQGWYGRGTFLGYDGGVSDVHFISPRCEDVVDDLIDSV